MRPSWIALAVFVVAVARVPAADVLKGTTAAERAEAQTLMMKEELGLSDAAVGKVAAINLKYARKMQPVIQRSGGSRKDVDDASSLQLEKEAELKAVLTPEQYKKYMASTLEVKSAVVQRVFEERTKKGQ